jgi:3-methylfumaryl-CoA hydratase
MFAGGEVEFSGVPVRVCDVVRVVTELADVTTKSGRSGEFVLAAFRSRISDLDGQVLVSERQDVVYTDPRPVAYDALPEVPTGSLPIAGRPLAVRDDGGIELRTDPTILMRFSALTANGHRIHYDLDYVREVEKLPGLLVHGPLLSVVLVQAICASQADRRVRRITHRNLNPLFCGQTARLAAVETEGGGVAAEIIGPGDEATAVKCRVNIEFHDG